MSSLADRLRGIVNGTAARPAPEPRGGTDPAELGPDAALEPPAAVLRASRTAEGALAEAASVLGGSLESGSFGATIVVERFYPAASRYGRLTIGEIASVLLQGGDALALLLSAWPGVVASGDRPAAARPGGMPALWFLDLETTGLAGGAGTQAFLVGCACLDREGFSLRQFLLPGFEHERALLEHVSAWVAERGALVTFNGKSFDVPLIETRYLYHRQPFPLHGCVHVDMLHPARRLWRARGEFDGSSDASCSLGTLEKLLAGVHRVGDVPGFEIPSRFFQFIRTGDARPLEAVMEHNRLDLVSLALVMARALTMIERGPGATQSPYECLGLARIYDRAGRRDEAEAAYLQAIDRLRKVGRDPETLADALRRLAYCRRRAARWVEAAEVWQQLADLPRCPSNLRHEAREALAIHHEHRARDLDAAHAHARRLIREQTNARQREAAEHRLRRLEHKLARQSPASASLWPEL